MSLFKSDLKPREAEWSVAILSSRETFATLRASIDAVILATSEVPSTVDVIVNGNRQLANQAGQYIQSLRNVNAPLEVRVWLLQLADKAHALNEYLYRISPRARIAYFVDGYARIASDALSLLDERLSSHPDALAISGAPTLGRNAKLLREQMVREGGVHGSLYAIRGTTCDRLRKCEFRLPLGLYRTDPLLFALLAFNLDPAENVWDTSRLLVQPQATWWFQSLNWRRPSDLRAYWKRMLRQGQGDLENLAIRQHFAVERKAASSLPRTASELVGSWLAASPARARAIFLRRPLCFVAARRLRQARDWSQASLPPEMIASIVLGGCDQPSSPATGVSCFVPA